MALMQLAGTNNEHEIWIDAMGRILTSVDSIEQQYFDANADSNDALLAYNEMASVSVLVGAANRLGMLALAEYITKKRCWYDRRRNADIRSRADLWIQDDDVHYGVEFKQDFHFSGADRLRVRLQEALEDASCLVPGDFNHRLGCLMVSMYYMDEHQAEQASRGLEKFSRDAAVGSAWKLVPENQSPTYFYFSAVAY